MRSLLEDGDIVNLDVSVYVDGFHGDTSSTFLVGDVDDRGRAGDKTGLKLLADLLRSPEGAAFLKAAKTLNVGVGGRVPRREVKEAVKVYVTFLEEQEPQLRKAVSRAASFTAKSGTVSVTSAMTMERQLCVTKTIT